MDLKPRKFSDLSSLAYEFYSSRLPNRPNANVLIAKFIGECGYGSGSNGDTLFMASILRAALYAWRSSGLILDLRELAYQWGDGMVQVFDGPPQHFRKQTHPFPVVAVVSTLNVEGLTSLVRDEMLTEPGEFLFNSIESASQRIEKLIDGMYQSA